MSTLGKTAPTLESLTEIYEAWIKRNGLPLVSAGDLHLEVDLTTEQRQFLDWFIEIWEAVDGGRYESPTWGSPI